MKTILHENVDGYEVVRGFGEQTVDAMATWAKIKEMVLTLPELAEANTVKTKMAEKANIAQNLAAAIDAAKKARNAAQEAAYLEKYNIEINMLGALEGELTEILKRFETSKLSLFEANLCYFTPGPGEAVVDDASFNTLHEKFYSLGQSQKLLFDGTLIPDLRGRKYWTKGDRWTSTIIPTLGVSIPSDGSVLQEDLSDIQKAEIEDQAESLRIADLTAEERSAELARLLQSVAKEAFDKKGMSEITGETFDAAAYYAEKKAILEARYA